LHLVGCTLEIYEAKEFIHQRTRDNRRTNQYLRNRNLNVSQSLKEDKTFSYHTSEFGNY